MSEDTQQTTQTESTNNQPTEIKSEPTNTNQSIDWSTVRLPDDHPLIKTLSLYKDKTRDYENRYKDVDPDEYRRIKQAQAETERKRLEEEGKWKELLDSQVSETKSEYEQRVNATQSELDAVRTEREDLKQQNQRLQSELNALYKERALQSVLATVDFNFDDGDNWKLFDLDFSDQFEWTDKGLKAKKDDKLVDPRELALEIVNTKQRFKKQPTGSGANPNGSIAAKIYDPKDKSKVVLPASFKTKPVRSELLAKGIEPKDLTRMILEGKVEWE